MQVVGNMCSLLLSARERQYKLELYVSPYGRLQVVPFWNAEMASLSVAPGSLVQHLEKRRMYSRKLSPGCCLQLRGSHCLPGRVYVPWKFRRKPGTGRPSC